ncbi:MAG: dockerin type I domain-containing protein, partial [Candidatus Omnitrophica bacterium]|nr:dockerin type I domain-containing protein [Candidatus Omnitrophota bacterium]
MYLTRSVDLNADGALTWGDISRANEIRWFWDAGVGYHLEDGKDIYQQASFIYTADAPTILEHYNVDGNDTFDVRDVLKVGDVVTRLSQYDVNSDGVLNDEDLAAWDTIEEYYALGLKITDDDLAKANIIDDYTGTGAVDEQDILRFLQISGSSYVNGSLRAGQPLTEWFLDHDFTADSYKSFDVDEDGELTVRDLSRIADVGKAVNYLSTTMLEVYKQVLNAEYFPKPDGSPSTDPKDEVIPANAVTHLDELENFFLCRGRYSSISTFDGISLPTYMRADLNLDGKIDKNDLTIYKKLFVSSVHGTLTPEQTFAFLPAVAYSTLPDYVNVIAGYLAGTYTNGMTLWDDIVAYERAQGMAELTGADKNLYNIIEMVRRAVQFSDCPFIDPLNTASAQNWMLKLLNLSRAADLTGDDLLTMDDYIRLQDTIESEKIRQTLKDEYSIDIKTRADVFARNPDGYMKYDVNKDGKIDDKDLADLKVMYKNAWKYDIAHYDGNKNLVAGRDFNSTVNGPVIDAADFEFMKLADRYMRLRASITQDEIARANISGDFDENGRPIVNDEDVKLIEGAIAYAKDVNKDRQYLAIANSTDYTTLMNIIGQGGMGTNDMFVMGLSRLDYNGDGVLNAKDLLIATGGFDEKDVACVKAASELINKYGFTLQDIRNADANFDGVVDGSDYETFKANLSGGFDLNRDGRIDGKDLAIINNLRAILYHGAVMPTAWMIASDVNGDGIVNKQDEKDLTDALIYYEDLDGDGEVTGADIGFISDVIEAGRMGITPENILNADFDKDARLDNTDFLRLKRVVDNAERYDLNGDGVMNVLDSLVIYNILGSSPDAIIANYKTTADGLLNTLQDISTGKVQAENLRAAIADIYSTAASICDSLKSAERLMSATDSRFKAMLTRALLEKAALAKILSDADAAILAKPAPVVTAYQQIEEAGNFIQALRDMAGRLAAPYRPQDMTSMALKAYNDAREIYLAMDESDPDYDQATVLWNDICRAKDNIEVNATMLQNEIARINDRAREAQENLTMLGIARTLIDGIEDMEEADLLFRHSSGILDLIRQAYWEADLASDRYYNSAEIRTSRGEIAKAYTQGQACLGDLRKKLVLKGTLALKEGAGLDQSEIATLARSYVVNVYSTAQGRQPTSEELLEAVTAILGSDGANPMPERLISAQLLSGWLLAGDFDSMSDEAFVSLVYKAFTGATITDADSAKYLATVQAAAEDGRGELINLLKTATWIDELNTSAYGALSLVSTAQPEGMTLSAWMAEEVKAVNILLAQAASVASIEIARSYADNLYSLYTDQLGCQASNAEKEAMVKQLLGLGSAATSQQATVRSILTTWLNAGAFEALRSSDPANDTTRFIALVYTAYTKNQLSEDRIDTLSMNADLDTWQKIIDYFGTLSRGDAADSDGDGFSDGYEKTKNTSPVDALSVPAEITEDDTDGDGITDDEETRMGLGPNTADSDGDGFSDGEEKTALTNPLDPDKHPPVRATIDSDGDEIDDTDEIFMPEDALGYLDSFKAIFRGLNIDTKTYLAEILPLYTTPVPGTTVFDPGQFITGLKDLAGGLKSQATDMMSSFDGIEKKYVLNDAILHNVETAEIQEGDLADIVSMFDTVSARLGLTAPAESNARKYASHEANYYTATYINKLACEQLSDIQGVSESEGYKGLVSSIDTLNTVAVTLSADRLRLLDGIYETARFDEDLTKATLASVIVGSGALDLNDCIKMRTALQNVAAEAGSPGLVASVDTILLTSIPESMQGTSHLMEFLDILGPVDLNYVPDVATLRNSLQTIARNAGKTQLALLIAAEGITSPAGAALSNNEFVKKLLTSLGASYSQITLGGILATVNIQNYVSVASLRDACLAKARTAADQDLVMFIKKLELTQTMTKESFIRALIDAIKPTSVKAVLTQALKTMRLGDYQDQA